MAIGSAALVALLTPSAGATVATLPASTVSRSAIKAAIDADRDLAAFYRTRDYQPLWIVGGALRPEAPTVVARLAGADADGLDPERYKIGELRAAMTAAQTGDEASLARAEALLSRAYADYLVDLHRPKPAATMAYVHDGLAPTPGVARQWLEDAARAPSFVQHLSEATRLNPIYEDLRAAYAGYRERWSSLPAVQVAPGPMLKPGAVGPRVVALRERLGLPALPARFDAALGAKLRAFQAAHGLPVDGAAGARTIAALNEGPARYERLIRANLERARAIPADPGDRFIVVDTVSATLRAYEGGQVAETMRVIVGKPDQPTPAMAGRISYAVLNPYWNLPPDLAQVRAQRVMAQGKTYLQRDKLEALSGWEADARVLSPDEVDWPGVARGLQKLRMRQTPGPHNMMGKIKFMLPNKLGIYLHDTPDKHLFTNAARRFSSGCVRLQDASRLSRWVFKGAAPDPAAAGPETRVDLPEPIPVYITYLTVEPQPGGGLAFRTDPYKRDAALLAALDTPSAAGSTGAPVAHALR